MAKNKKLDVLGFTVTVRKDEYISLTDIAKSVNVERPGDLIARWLQNSKTLLFLETWEKLHNPNFDLEKMQAFRLNAVSLRFGVNSTKYIEETGAMGMTSKKGRYGGTFAHLDLAIAFAYWLEPSFQVYFIHEFNRMKKDELDSKTNTLKFSFDKMIDRANDLRIMAEMGKSTLDDGEEE